MNSKTDASRDQDEIGVALRLKHVEHIFAVIACKHRDFWRLGLGRAEGKLQKRTLHSLQLRKKEKLQWKPAISICNFSFYISHPEPLLTTCDKRRSNCVLENLVDAEVREDAGLVVSDSELLGNCTGLVWHHQITLFDGPDEGAPVTEVRQVSLVAEHVSEIIFAADENHWRLWAKATCDGERTHFDGFSTLSQLLTYFRIPHKSAITQRNRVGDGKAQKHHVGPSVGEPPVLFVIAERVP